MNRIKFYRHDANGAVQKAVVLVTQSHAALNRGGRRYRTAREAGAEMMKNGWTRKRLKPLTAAELVA